MPRLSRRRNNFGRHRRSVGVSLCDVTSGRAARRQRARASSAASVCVQSATWEERISFMSRASGCKGRSENWSAGLLKGRKALGCEESRLGNCGAKHWSEICFCNNSVLCAVWAAGGEVRPFGERDFGSVPSGEVVVVWRCLCGLERKVLLMGLYVLLLLLGVHEVKPFQFGCVPGIGRKVFQPLGKMWPKLTSSSPPLTSGAAYGQLPNGQLHRGGLLCCPGNVCGALSYKCSYRSIRKWAMSELPQNGLWRSWLGRRRWSRCEVARCFNSHRITKR